MLSSFWRRGRNVLLVLSAFSFVAMADTKNASLGDEYAEPSNQLLLAESDVETTETLDAVVVEGDQEKESRQSTLSNTTKVTGEQAEDLGLQDVRSTLKIQGNTYTSPSNNGNNGISIRGINSEGVGEPGGNSRPLTTLIIDGAAQSIEGVRRGQRGTWDIGAIEVARGPQSTLQGRNTMAGSITVNTKDPTDYWEASARLIAGQLDLFSPAIMISGPLSEEFAFRISAEASESEKDIDYSDPATEHLREDEYRNVRGKLLYRPDAALGLDIKLTVSHTLDDPAVMAVSGPENGYDYRDRFFDVTETAAESRRNKIRNNVVEVGYDLDSGARFVATTAFVETDAYIDGTGSVGGQPYMRDELRSDEDISQLFRYIYEPADATFTGEAGVFLGRFQNDRDSLVTVGNIPLQDLTSERVDKNAAVFGELWWRFIERWRLVTGLRVETESTDQSTESHHEGYQQSGDYENTVALPKVGVLHELNDIDTLAFTISSGYRGGFREVEPVEALTDRDGYDVDPEFLINYEVAYRSSWLDDTVKFNASLFYNDWKDQQVTVNLIDYLSGTNDSLSASVFTRTLNAGESHSYGLELDLAWSVFAMTDVGVSLGYLQTGFDDFSVYPEVEGNEFPEAPHVSGGMWFISRFDRGWFVAGDVSGRGSAYATSDLYNDPAKKVPGYVVMDIRGGFEWDYVSAVVFVDNLFDRDYLVGRDRLGGYYVADARVAGVTLTARY